VVKTPNYCRANKGLKIFAWVILDNHMYLLAASEQISKNMKEFKSFTAREIIRLAQEGYHPQIITTEQMLRQKIEYIHQAVTAGLVDNSEDWPYTSARNYLGLEGLLELDPLVV
jgi:REP element-mobilizing transposase RayT